MPAIEHLTTTHTQRKPWIHHKPKGFASNKSISSLPHTWDLLRQGLLIMSVDDLITAGLITLFCRSQVKKVVRPSFSEIWQWTWIY